jgi:hypothetical protein
MTDETSVVETPAEEVVAPETVTVHAAYVVVINSDGTLNTTAVTPAGLKPFTVERVATATDIFKSSKEIVSDIESQILADRVTRRVVAALKPADNPETGENN